MNKPTIIAVAIVKGGSAKTTTSMEIAGLLARRGKHVVVLDSDNTGGATLWDEYVRQANEADREANPDAPDNLLGFEVTPANAATLSNRRRIFDRYRGYDYVIIDTPPSDVGIMKAATSCADVTIIPSQPSISDMSHAGKTYAETQNAIVLLTRVKPRTRLARNAIAELDEHGITRFETVITEREAIKNHYGTTDVDNAEYSSVVQELIDYLDQQEA